MADFLVIFLCGCIDIHTKTTMCMHIDKSRCDITAFRIIYCCISIFRLKKISDHGNPSVIQQ